jgi:Protein of unknown function (DUF2442)
MPGRPFLPEPTKVAFDADVMWVSLSDGRIIGAPLAWFPRLLRASPDERADMFLSPSGLHWEALDEDISVETLIAGLGAALDAPRHAA